MSGRSTRRGQFYVKGIESLEHRLALTGNAAFNDDDPDVTVAAAAANGEPDAWINLAEPVEEQPDAWINLVQPENEEPDAWINVVDPVGAAPDAGVTDTIVNQSQPLVLNTAGQVYQLQTSLRFNGKGVVISAANVTLDLNGHTIYYGGSNAANVHGVEIDGNQARVINGSIVHEGSGATSHGIYVSADNGTIEDMRVEVNGTDSATVYCYWDALTIRDSVLISHANDSFDRHAGPANVFAPWGQIIASGNVLIGGNSGFNVSSGSQITGNVISHNGHVTNGYGVFLYDKSNVTVADNLIVPSNGRGVIINSGSNNQVLDNVILHLESPNAEFGEALDPPAVRVRYDVYNNVVRGNTSLGIAGGARTAASGLSLTNTDTGTNTYENNSLTTILVGSGDLTHYAQPLTMEGHGGPQPSNDVIRNNVLRSNEYLIRVSGWDGNANQSPMLNNSLAWVNGNTARDDFVAAMWAKLQDIGMNANADAVAVLQQSESLIAGLISGVGLSSDRATWFAKYWETEPTVATLLDSQWGSGVAPDSFDSATLNTGTVNIRVGQTVHARLVNGSGTPLANTNFTLTTDRGDTYSLRTDAAGLVDLPVIEFGLDKANATNAPIVKNLRTTSTLTVSGFPQLVSNNATLLANGAGGVTVTLTLGGGGTPNQAPVNTVPGAQTTNEDTPRVFSTANGNLISVADADAGSSAVRVTLTATNGTVTLNSTSGLTFTAGDGTSDATVTFSGTLANLNTALAGMRFNPTANYSGTASVQIVTNDLGNTGTGGALSDTDTVSITVSAVNDTPVNTVPGAQTTAQNTARIFSSANGNLISVADVDAGSSSVRVTLTATNGTATLNSTSGLTFTAGDGTSDATMTFSGTLANLNNALAGLRFNPTSNFTGAASVQIVTNDLGNTGSGGALSDTDTISIAITSAPANTAPANTVPGAQTVSEDTALVFSSANGNLISVADVDAGSNSIRVTLTATNGTVTLNSTTGLTFTAGDGTSDATVTFSGTLANLNNALAGLRFNPTSNVAGAASVQIVTNDLGNTGTGGALSDTDTVPITVSAVNDTPVNTVPGAQTTVQNTARVFSSANGNLISVADIDAGSSSVRVTLTATNGTTTLNSTSGLTFTAGDGTNDATMTFAGTLANLNNALSGLQFIPIAGFTGNGTLQVVTNDLGNTGSGGALSDSDTVSITVSATSSGLVAAYSFDANTGATLVDATGNGHAGTISGATWTTAGRFGSALLFDGVNDWVTINDANGLDLTTGMTVMAWVYPTAINGYETVLLKENTSHLAYALYADDASGRPTAETLRGTTQTVARGTSQVPLNTWTHLAATYDGANLRLYVNGAVAATVAQTGPLNTTSAPLHIGGNAIWGEWFNGRIDEVRIYNAALDQSRITTDMNTRVESAAAAAILVDANRAPIGGEFSIATETAPELPAPSKSPTKIKARGFESRQAEINMFLPTSSPKLNAVRRVIHRHAAIDRAIDSLVEDGLPRSAP